MSIQPTIFGGNTGMTYDELQRKRKIADQLMSKMQTPRNVGEGLTAIGNALAIRGMNRKADKRDTELRGEFNDQWGSLFNGGVPSAVPGGYEGGSAGAMGSTSQAEPFSSQFPVGDDGPDPRESVSVGGTDYAMGTPVPRGAPAGLLNNESGGRLDAYNNEVGSGGSRGHGGRAQMGNARLQDAARAGVIPSMTAEQFAQQPDEVQAAAENWHWADLDNQIKAQGLDRFYGQNVGGVPVTRDAVVSMAHLGGIGGAAKFLESGGQHNPSDTNGTSLRDYGTRFNGGNQGNSFEPGQGTQMAQAGGMNMQTLADVAGSPYASPGQKVMAQQLLQQQMQAMDPNSRLDFQLKQAQLNQIQNPAVDPMDAVQLEQAQLNLEQDRNPDPGFRVLSPDEAAAMNLPAGAFQVGTDGKVSQIGGAGTKIDISTGTETGQYLYGATNGVPAGWRIDKVSGEASRIPGGPAIAEQAEGAAAEVAAAGNATTAGDLVTTAAGFARDADETRIATGLFGTIAAINPGSNNAEIVRQLGVLRGIAKTSNLQAMRQASKTGGALGSVSAPELTMLEQMSGALDPASPNFARDLNNYERTLLRTIHGPEAGDAIFEQTRQPAKTEAGSAPASFSDKYKADADAAGLTVDELWAAWGNKEAFQ